MLAPFERINGKNPVVKVLPLQVDVSVTTPLLRKYADVKMEFSQLKVFVLEKLSKELKPTLYYHNFQHTLDVIRSVETLAIMEKVSKNEVELLITAALFHDTGFLWAYDRNEPFACKFAKEVLPRYGYTPIEISLVCSLIHSTAMPQKPKTLLEKIICDADLDYIGREDFFITALRLHREWSENSEPKISFRDWYEKQRSFMESHVYFTNSAKLLRNERKKMNLRQVNELLELIDKSTSLSINLTSNIKN